MDRAPYVSGWNPRWSSLFSSFQMQIIVVAVIIKPWRVISIRGCLSAVVWRCFIQFVVACVVWQWLQAATVSLQSLPCNVASLTFCHQDKTKKEKETKRGSQRNSRYVFSWQRHWWRQLWNRNTHTEWLCTCEVKPSHEHRKVLLDPTSEWGETLAFTSFALCLISFTPICEQQIAFSF